MLKKFNSIALAMVFCASIALAQVTTGTISGVVRDATGAVVPGASVVVRNVETGVSRTVSTDAQGQYRAPNISLGRYEVQASLTGFQTAVRSGISLSVGQEAAVNFTLEVGQVTERVEVTGEAPLVETTRSDVGGVIEENQVTDLPLNGRSFLQLAQLQTGMVAARNASNLSFGGQQTVLATSGSQAGSSSFLLDGSDISDYMFAQTPGGASGLAVGLEMIREFRVLTNSFSAEYGRSSGGVLSVVTKSGTNQLEGTVFWFHRNDNLDARNFFDGAKSPEFRRNQFGGTLGGPIVRDKTFFLGSYEGLREGLGQTALAIVPSLRAREGFLPRSGGGEDNVGVAPAVRPFLNLYPLPTGQTFPNGTAEARSLGTQPTNEDFFSGRIDHVLSEKDTLFGRYTFRDGTTIVPFGSTPVPGFGAVGDQRHQYMTAEETHVFSPTVLNSFRASYNRSRKDNPTDPPAPETCASLLPACSGQGPVRPGSGVDPLGNRASRPSFSTVNLFQVHDSVYVTRGSHSLKFGTEITRFQGHFDYHFNLNGTYGFRNLSDFLRGAPNTFEGVLPGADLIRGWRWTYLGFYVQDEWRMFPNFTLNLGLRYEPQTNPKEVNGKLANLLDPLNDSKMTVVDSLFSDNPGRKLFQPRVGFAWDPFRNGKLALRGGFGVFFDKVHSNTFNGQNTNVPFATTVLINDPLFPKALRPGETFTPTSISVSTITPDRNFSYPYSMQWNFSIQQEIVPSTVVSATYAGSRGVHILVQGELNLNKWEFRDGRKFFPRTRNHLNPAFAAIRGKIPQGNSSFHSLQLNLKRRMSAGLQFQAAYTWSKVINDGATFGAAPVGNSNSDIPDMFDTKLSRGLGDLDVRHNLVFSSSYQLPFASGNRWLGGWQLGGILTLASGIPFSQYVNFNRSRSLDRGGNSEAPDRVREPAIDSRNVERYFDLNAFQLQPEGFFGNAGWNSVIGPGLATVDFSVIKKFSITERANLEWRLEMFNIFNRANFRTPADNGGGFSKSNVFTDQTGVPIPTAGKIVLTSTTARQIQMGLKISF